MPQNRIAPGGSPLDPIIQYLVDGLVADYPDSPLEPWRVELALAIADEEVYAATLQRISDAELIERHSFMETVAQSSGKQRGPFFVLLEMHAQCLADLCAREGIRRGNPRWGRLH